MDGAQHFAVMVDDDGPGLQRGELEKVRLDESKPSSGLGLSIVADLAPSV
jgi:hypothetical protein